MNGRSVPPTKNNGLGISDYGEDLVRSTSSSRSNRKSGMDGWGKSVAIYIFKKVSNPYGVYTKDF